MSRGTLCPGVMGYVFGPQPGSLGRMEDGYPSSMNLLCTNGFYFPTAAVINYHKLTGLRQHKVIILELCRSEI